MSVKKSHEPKPWRCNVVTCGGGVVVGKASGDGRPEYRCTKCRSTWTRGLKGEPWDDGIQHRDPQPQKL